jgi:hypothetical protein
VLPIGSIVLDNVNAKLYQATDSLGTYAEVGSGGGALTFGRGLTGDGGVGDPLRMSGEYHPAVDAVNAFEIRKADGVTDVLSVDTANTVAVLNGKMNLGKVDAFGRTMMWNYGTNSVLKLGSLAQDGDPADVSSEGVVLVGANSAGTFDATNWAFVRLKSTRIGINNCVANVQQYIFRADETGMYLRNDAGAKTFEVDRATGLVKVSGGFQPVTDSATALQFRNAAGTSTLFNMDTLSMVSTTNYKLVVQGVDVAPQIENKLLAFKGDIVYPKALTLSGIERSVATEGELVAAIAASSTGDSILVTADFNITATITVNKSVKIYGNSTTRAISSAGGATDPVVMFSITANNVLLGPNLTIWHKKTTNTSVECAVSVNASGFVSYATIKFMEFGYTLRGSFSIFGAMTYTGAFSNNHRFIGVYRIDAPSQVNGVVFDYPFENPARASFVLLTSSLASDKMNSVLRVAFCRQLNETRRIRQFFLQDAFLTDAAGVNPALIFEGNQFNDSNGGIGLYTTTLSAPLNFFAYIAVLNNWQGDESVFSYKGLFYVDGTRPLFDLGATKIFYGGNRHPTTVRAAGYVDAYDMGGVGYNSVQYYANTPISYTIQKGNGTSYDYALRSLYDLPTAASLGTLLYNSAAKPVPLDADLLALANTASSNVLSKMTFGDLKAFLKTYFDTLYGGGGGMAVASNTLSGEQSVLPNTEVVLFTYTVPVGKKLTILNGNGSSDGDAVWRIVENGTTKLKLRNAHQDRNVSLLTPFELAAGAVLTVYGKNVTIEGETNEIGVWLHVSEVNA